MHSSAQWHENNFLLYATISGYLYRAHLPPALCDSKPANQFWYISSMPKELPIGLRGAAEMTVAHEHTLNHHNPELPAIFSTPHMIGLMEWAAANAMKPYCDPGEISVGTAINIEHRAPTVVGQHVRAEATFESMKGKFYVFRVTARNDDHLIGCGTVTRAFVNPAKVAQKYSSSSKA